MSTASKMNMKQRAANELTGQHNLAQRKCPLIFGLLMLVFCGPALAQKRALIAFDGVEIFALPLDDKAPVALLMRGDTVRVIGQRGDWVKVEFAPGKKGWMQIQINKGQTKSARTRSPRARRRRQPDQTRTPTALVSRSSRDVLASPGPSNGGVSAEAASEPDEVQQQPTNKITKQTTGRFGYAFGMGLLETDFAYNWKFVFHQTPRVALEGSFKHALGQAANSYLLMANWTYLLQVSGRFLPYLSGGMGVINTVPERSINTGGVSHMAINYGGGVRKFFRNNITLLLGGSMYSVFVGKGVRHFKELTVGFMVGKFWD